MALTLLIYTALFGMWGLLAWALWAWAASPFLRWHERLEHCDYCWRRKWPRAVLREAVVPKDGVFKARRAQVHRRCAKAISKLDT